MPRKARRLTQLEWRVLLDAACLYESEPANFEEDNGAFRHEALMRAITKMQRAEKWPGK